MKTGTIAMVAMLLTVMACERPLKDIEDYYPEVTTISATLLPDGHVRVEGRLDGTGAGDMLFVGFCADTLPVPTLDENQITLESFDANSFSVEYDRLLTGRTYYFRSFAVNAYGYSYGNTLSVDSVFIVPVEPPCTLAANSVDIGGSPHVYNTISSPTQSFDIWEVIAESASGPRVFFRFGSELKTGIFKTVNSSTIEPGRVSVFFEQGAISDALNPGWDVYVNQLSETTWEIAICDAPWLLGSSTMYFNTRFVVSS